MYLGGVDGYICENVKIRKYENTLILAVSSLDSYTAIHMWLNIEYRIYEDM